MTKYPRRCDATGRGIYQGYVCNDGEFYFAEQSDLIDDDDLMEFFYNEDYYCYTEWSKFDIDDVYYDEEGNEYEKQ